VFDGEGGLTMPTTQHRLFAPSYLDVESVPAFKTELAPLLNDLSIQVIVVDCRELTFIDSYGLRALLSTQRNLESEGRRLRVANLSPSIRRTFDVTGVTGVLRAG
jgi:anti-anti-sigma factor